MQIPIVSGIYADSGPDFRTSYPVNMMPVPKVQGISEGYLRPHPGIVSNGSRDGACRGGVNWDGVLYRVMGSQLVRVAEDGTTTAIGSVGGSGDVSFAYSFDYLAVASGGNLWLYNGLSLTQVTDTDLGVALDVIWVDGYFMTTDGTSLVVTELNDPFSVNPLKYGSSEIDPDPVKSLLKLRNEVYALNRYTIEVFTNVGGGNFPFQRVEGAAIPRGCVGTHARALFADGIAFIGSAKDESPSIHIGNNGASVRIATNEIDTILGEYTEAELSLARLEARGDKAYRQLYVYLPWHTLVYDVAATAAIQQPVWFHLSTSLTGSGPWDACSLVWCYNRWNVARTGQLGYLSDTVSTHWGEKVAWSFGTPIIYNESRGAIFHQIELVALTGRTEFGDDPIIGTQYSLDGVTWSQEKTIKAGKSGERQKRLVWLQQGTMQNWRTQRFIGTSDAHLSFARLEAQIEPLAF